VGTVLTMGRRVGFLVGIACALTACNQVAGIADLREGEADASDDASEGAASSPDDAGTDGVADAALDVAPPLPSCNDPQVALVIDVIDSKSGNFTGITDGNGLFSTLTIGQTFRQCVPRGTVLDLRADPGDPSDAVHDWGVCGMGRRCDMTVQQPTVLEVHLQ
jgi:hypothetical protein